ncbi:MAG: alpha/beta hydrolase [Aestuariivirga sp.]|uniref:alpha/beta fold hydrolase n=1 Tax=Aestuariivirga sp. TaxID=2650926 RepID=UPI003015D0CC
MIYEYFMTADNVRLAYKDEGSGLPLLALAGLTRDGRDFDYLSHHLPRCRLIRLDSRGRGGSQWANVVTYTVAHEAADAIALLDHLDIPQAAVIGTSRGGLLGLLMAATARQRLLGLCLNDVGPVVEFHGLERIAEYVGIHPAVATIEEVMDRLPARSPGFVDVPDFRWAEEAVRHFVETPDGLNNPYDPAIGEALRAALTKPLADAWPLFDACAGLPLALIRAENSDILSQATATEMRRRRPDMLFAEVAKRGHAPFLDEPAAISLIHEWLTELEDYRPPAE